MGTEGRVSALLIAAVCAALAACGGCGTGLGPDGSGDDSSARLVVASWNVQALFDGHPDGTEYDDYSASSGWTEEKYRERLVRIGRAVGLCADGGPDVLALIEVENAAVVGDLLSGPLSDFGYRWYARAANEGAALGICVLSRHPIEKSLVHAVSYRGETAPRPILEVRIDAGGVPLVVLACHWKSKLGGDEATEPLRAASASALARRISQLARDEPGLDVLVLGDLNESYREFELGGGRYATALLPDSVDGEAVWAASGLPRPVLVVDGSAPPKAARVGMGVPVFSPWPTSSWRGSYAYRGAWEAIDHALAPESLFDGAGWDYACFSVVDAEPLVGSAGYPASYYPRTGTGYSDHLPLVVELARRDDDSAEKY